MKYRIMLSVFLCFYVSMTFSQNKALPINIEAKTSSNGGNSLTELIITPSWSESASSELALRMLMDNEIGAALSDDPKSLLATKYKRLEADLLLMKRNITLGRGISFSLAAGIDWWNENELERGYFAFGGDAQLMANQTSINYFMPVLSGNLSAKLGAIQFSDSCSYSPLFYYTLDQSVAIQPLVDSQYSQSVNGWGKTIISNELIIRLFNIVNLSWYFDLTSLDFPYLRLGSDQGTATFYPVTSSSKSINHTLMAGFSLPIGDDTRILIQLGKNFSSAIDLDQNIEIDDQSFVWEASLSLR